MKLEAPDLQRRGLMFVLSSPSGAGKSTLARLLLSEDKNLEISVSVTTRTRRPSEVDGRHYHFINRAAFERMRDHGELLEWAEVHGYFYGTPREPVEKALAQGQDVLFDIDWQGTEQLAAIEAIRSGLATFSAKMTGTPASSMPAINRAMSRAEGSPASVEREPSAVPSTSKP